MAFRIETAARGRFTVYKLSGRIEEPAIDELRRFFECRTDYRDIVLDLKDVTLIESSVEAIRKNLRKIWAHVYIDTAIDDAAAALQRMGGARAILATAPSGDAMGPLVQGLAVRGKLIVVGAPQDQMQLSAFPLVFGGRSIYGSLAGTAIESEDALAFSVLENIRPMIETVPLEQAADGYARMMQGKARFRMILFTKDRVTQSA